MRITGLEGDTRDIARDKLDTFAAGLDGSLIYPDDDGFAEAILIWNGMIKKQPAVVVRPSTTRDVVQTVDFVRGNELLLSIKGGGHNIAGLALCDGGVTLDMSGMRRSRSTSRDSWLGSVRAAPSVTSTRPRRFTTWQAPWASFPRPAWRG